MTVHTIDLEFQGAAELIASYVVETGEGLVLVEPGPESARGTLLAKMGGLGLAPSDVGAVLITHAHLDHCGAGGWWAGQGATLYVHPRAARHIVDPTRLVEGARQVFGGRSDSLWGETLPAPEDKVVALDDGERVSIAGVEFEAIDTPGHAFHHHAYAMDDGTLFTGDVAGMRLPGSRYLSVTSAPTQFHLGSYLASIDRLRERRFERLLLTHFGQVSGVDDHWDRYRQRVAEVAEQVGELTEGDADPAGVRSAYGVSERAVALGDGVDDPTWERLEMGNNTAMCADGLRMYWERRRSEGD